MAMTVKAVQWTEKALELLPETGKVAAIIRHAEKEKKHPGIPDDGRLLTETGKAAAAGMGRLLRGRLASVCHSPVKRCRQTAECLAAGGGATVGEEFLRLAGRPDILSSRECLTAGKAKEGFVPLIDKVASGGYPGFNNPRTAAAKMFAWMFARAVPGININVSHDWVVHLLAFASGAKTATFEEEKVDYLDALFLWEQNGAVRFYYRGRSGAYGADFCRLIGEELK